jgi:acyl carrier protein
MDKKRIEQAIYNALEEVNQLLSRDLRLNKSPDTVIIGENGKLDSLGLVNLIVATEARVQEEFGITINLADANIMSSVNSPLNTVGQLIDYVEYVLNNNSNGPKDI